MLYIVSTPIGNLDDISLRQAKTLMSSDVILAEDTRSARILLEAIEKRFPQLTANKPQLTILSYYKEKEFEKLPEVIEYLKEGKNLSLISESGTPLVSDPGSLLIKTCIKRGIPFTAIPGASALISGLVLSGFNTSQFIFLGFFPKKPSEKLKFVKKLRSIKEIFADVSIVFYESSLRINETFQSFIKLGWDPEAAVCREMTKKFEEIVRGKASDLATKSYKGELTIVLR